MWLSTERAGTIRRILETIGLAGPAHTALESDSRITGESGSASDLVPVNGWGRGATHGGGHTNGVGGITSITITSASIISTSTITGGQA